MTDLQQQEPPPAASFDADESRAMRVLAHVPAIQDRLRLACASTWWRKVAGGGSPACWEAAGFDSLVLDGHVAGRLTDARLLRLLTYAGPNLRSLTVHGAPLAFTGEGLLQYALRTDLGAPPLATLETLNLSGCLGVEVGGLKKRKFMKVG